MRLEPDCEGLGKILGGMRLRVPRAEMLHKTAAAGPRPVGVGIGQRSRTECLAPGFEASQTVRRINGVPGLVTQNTHQPVAIAAFHFAHEATLETYQSGVSQIERDGDARDAIRREPLLRQPAMRSKAQA